MMKGIAKKRWIGFVVISLLMLVIAGCGGKKEGAAVEVNQQNIEYLKGYDKDLTSFISRQTDILNVFNDSLTNLYTGNVSKEQFSTLLKGLIDDSKELIREVENYDVDPAIFENHSQYTSSVNGTHQLLLDAIEVANYPEGEIDKVALRTRYVELKSTQSSLLNSWKILQEQLQTPPPTQ